MKPHRSGLAQSGITSCNGFPSGTYLPETYLAHRASPAHRAREDSPPYSTREVVSHVPNHLEPSSSGARSSKYSDTRYKDLSASIQSLMRDSIQPRRESSAYNGSNPNVKFIPSNSRHPHLQIPVSRHKRLGYDCRFRSLMYQHTDPLNRSMVSRLGQDEDIADSRHPRFEHASKDTTPRTLFHNETARPVYCRQPHQVISSSSKSSSNVPNLPSSQNRASLPPRDGPTYRRTLRPVVSHRTQRPVFPPPLPYHYQYLSDFSTSSESEVDSDYEYSETEEDLPQASELNITKSHIDKSEPVQVIIVSSEAEKIDTDDTNDDKIHKEPSNDVKPDTDTIEPDNTDIVTTDTIKAEPKKSVKYERRLRRSVSEVFESSGKIKEYPTISPDFLGLFIRPNYLRCISSSIDILSKTRKIKDLEVRHKAKQAQLKQTLPEFPIFEGNIGWGLGLYIKITRRCDYDKYTRSGQCRGKCLGKGTYLHRNVPFCLKPQCTDATCKGNHPFYFPNNDTFKLSAKDFSILIIRHYTSDWFPIMLENQTKGLDPDVDIVCNNLKTQFDKVKNPRKREAGIRLNLRNKLRYLNDSIRRELVVLKWLNGQMPRYYRYQEQRLKLVSKVVSLGEEEITNIIKALVGSEDWKDAQCVLDNPSQFGDPATIIDDVEHYKIWNEIDPYYHFDNRDLELEPDVHHDSDDELLLP